MATLVIGLYVACNIIANVTASKPVMVGGIVVPAAVFIYTLTFTLIDLVNERLGKGGARQVVYAAFAANLLLAGYSWFAIAPQRIKAGTRSVWAPGRYIEEAIGDNHRAIAAFT